MGTACRRRPAGRCVQAGQRDHLRAKSWQMLATVGEMRFTRTGLDRSMICSLPTINADLQRNAVILRDRLRPHAAKRPSLRA